MGADCNVTDRPITNSRFTNLRYNAGLVSRYE